MNATNSAVGQEPAMSSQPASRRAAKRTRYTTVACDECKRRKLKCDGQVPCQRCARHLSTCVYPQREGSMASRQKVEISRMREVVFKQQEQINLLMSNAATGAHLRERHQHHSILPQDPITPTSASVPTQMNTSTSPDHTNNHDSSPARHGSRAAKHSQYQGPTSAAYNLGVATASLKGMGIHTRTTQDCMNNTSYSTTPARSSPSSNEVTFLRDPLLSITLNQATHLVRVYEEESGTVYPFIDIDLVMRTAEQFYSRSIMSNGGNSVVSDSDDANMLSGGVVDILKLVIAIALVIQGHGPTTLSSALLDNVETGFKGRLCGPSVDILEIQAWTLMSILQFQCDEEALAWRTIGLAARAAVELGLHHPETYLSRFSNPQQRLWANKLFWCIYILDKRWSFGTGLPFALHDDDIDPELLSESKVYSTLLKTMITYGRLGSKVWKATCNLNTPVSTDEQAFLEFQVQQWQSSIEPDLQLYPSSENMLDHHSRAKNRLRVLLYLRANQMRLLIFRRVLLSPKTIINDNEGARKAVCIAKDIVRVLNKLNRTSDIYASQQACFNYFLVSALTAMLLAVCHGTAQFALICREEFYQALELVRGFSSKSHIGQRLWKTVKHLKVIGLKLGVLPSQGRTYEGLIDSHTSTTHHQASSTTHSQHSSGLGLASGYPANLASTLAVSPSYDFSLDGNELGNDLTAIFESFEHSFEQATVLDPGAGDVSGHLDFCGYETLDGLARSLFNLG